MATNTESRLLNLPRELRDQILEYALVDKEPVLICLANGSDARYSDPLHTQYEQRECVRQTGLNLASVCTQLRAEVHDIFFSQNIFSSHLADYTRPRDDARLPCSEEPCSCTSLIRHLKSLRLTHFWDWCGVSSALLVKRGGEGWEIEEEGKPEVVWLSIKDPDATPVGQGFSHRDLCLIVEKA